jgi:hypothetical protein
MSIDDFARYSQLLHRLTVDFVRAVPEDKWAFTPDPPGQSGRARAPHRIGHGFAPFCKQLRHVVCVRGVYNAALEQKQQQLLATLETVDIDAPIDWDGAPFTFALFTWEFVKREAIHHGQWSIYASLAGFDTPLSWRSSWGL